MAKRSISSVACPRKPQQTHHTRPSTHKRNKRETKTNQTQTPTRRSERLIERGTSIQKSLNCDATKSYDSSSSSSGHRVEKTSNVACGPTRRSEPLIERGRNIQKSLTRDATRSYDPLFSSSGHSVEKTSNVAGGSPVPTQGSKPRTKAPDHGTGGQPEGTKQLERSSNRDPSGTSMTTCQQSICQLQLRHLSESSTGDGGSGLSFSSPVHLGKSGNEVLTDPSPPGPYGATHEEGCTDGAPKDEIVRQLKEPNIVITTTRRTAQLSERRPSAHPNYDTSSSRGGDPGPSSFCEDCFGDAVDDVDSEPPMPGPWGATRKETCSVVNAGTEIGDQSKHAPLCTKRQQQSSILETIRRRYVYRRHLVIKKNVVELLGYRCKLVPCGATQEQSDTRGTQDNESGDHSNGTPRYSKQQEQYFAPGLSSMLLSSSINQGGMDSKHGTAAAGACKTRLGTSRTELSSRASSRSKDKTDSNESSIPTETMVCCGKGEVTTERKTVSSPRCVMTHHINTPKPSNCSRLTTSHSSKEHDISSAESNRQRRECIKSGLSLSEKGLDCTKQRGQTTIASERDNVAGRLARTVDNEASKGSSFRSVLRLEHDTSSLSPFVICRCRTRQMADPAKSKVNGGGGGARNRRGPVWPKKWDTIYYRDTQSWDDELPSNRILKVPLLHGGLLRVWVNLVDQERLSLIQAEMRERVRYRQYRIQNVDEPRIHSLYHPMAGSDRHCSNTDNDKSSLRLSCNKRRGENDQKIDLVEDDNCEQPGYSYAQITMKARPLAEVPEIARFASDLGQLCGVSNWGIGVMPICYRDGQDKMGLHADDDQGEQRIVTVLIDSPPQIRPVLIQTKLFSSCSPMPSVLSGEEILEEQIQLLLQPGDAYEMDDEMQLYYVHGVPKDAEQVGRGNQRLAIVFRSGQMRWVRKDSGRSVPNLEPRPPNKTPYVFGPVPGILYGHEYSRAALIQLRGHSACQRGISGSVEFGCDAIIVSRKRQDNLEDDRFGYLLYAAEHRVGAGGLLTSSQRRECIRVFRRCGRDNNGTKEGQKKHQRQMYRYDGLYEIIAIHEPEHLAKQRTVLFILRMWNWVPQLKCNKDLSPAQYRCTIASASVRATTDPVPDRAACVKGVLDYIFSIFTIKKKKKRTKSSH